jgi:Zn-dependent protease
MIDLVSLSIPLGRWFGISVRLHWFFVIYLGTVIVRSLFQSTPIGRGLLEAGAICILLVLAVATRELTQLTLLPRLGLSRVDVRLWPLGNLVVAGSVLAKRSVESAFIAATTLVTGLSLTLAAGLGLAMSGAWLELNPFGGAQGGSPMLSTGQPAAAFTPLWWIGWFGYWNWVLFLANLIPALPFEMGRIVRGCVRTSHRETEVFPYLARGIAILSALVGATRLYSGKPGGVELLCIALLIEWLVRLESRQLEESGSLKATQV